MKHLITALALTFSANAFAFSPEEVAKTLQDRTVLQALDGKNITAITQGPSYRCLGCFGLTINAYDYQNDRQVKYTVHGMDFNGRFSVRIGEQR